SHMSLGQASSFGRVVGRSRAMRILYPALQRLAGSDQPVLLEGEAGAGKELCAEEIHAHSARAGRPFLALDCQTLPPGTVEERLFGPSGVALQASGGTVFIDEITALPIRIQKSLVGELARPLPVRLVFGTHHDLDHDVGEGRFSEALLVQLAP